MNAPLLPPTPWPSDPDGEATAPTAIRHLPVLRHGPTDGPRAEQDALIEEVPVALVFNGVSHAVMLASPTDLPDLALGFALSEGILTSPAQLYALEVHNSCDGLSIEMHIASRCFTALKERRRSLAGRTGCGLCGVDSLAAVHRIPVGSRAPAAPAPSAAALDAALHQLRKHQPLHRQTGAAHGAAWVSPGGEILCLREDVGRHNALDKLIGALARTPGSALHEGFVLVTSRASYEMVQKVACAGGHTLVAVSAPTALAVRQAEAAGVLLIGFARPGQWNSYTQATRAAPTGRSS